MLTTSSAYKGDYEHYKEYVRNRELLFDTEIDGSLEYSYQLLYIFSTISSSISKFNSRSKVKHFYNEVKNNLIISFDLINMNYLNSAKQILRSAIESFFRFFLSVSQYIEYRENKKKKIYNATIKLKDLKSMVDTHSVWKMTSYTVNFFENTPISNTIRSLNEHYGVLSGNVHVNAEQNFTLKEYLSEYAQYDLTKSQETINIYNIVLTNMLISIYYSTFLLLDENVFIEKRNIQALEANKIIEINKILDDIDIYFA